MATGESGEASAARSGGLLQLYRELWRYAAGERRLLIGSMLLLLGSQLIKLSTPYLSGRAINALQLRGLPGLGEAGLWLLAVFGATLGSWALHLPGRVLERNIALTVRRRLSAELIEKLLRLPLAWHERYHSGSVAHRVEQASRALYDFAQSQFIYLQNAVQLVGPVFALWAVEPWVGVAALVGLGLISVSITGFDRVMMALAHRENDSERRYATMVIDTLGNISSVFALRQSRGVAALIQRRLLAVYEPIKRSILVNEAKWCAVDVLSMALSCALMALFAWLATRGLSAHARVAAGAGRTPTLPLGHIYMVWAYALQAGGVISGVAAHFQTFARQQADFASGDIIREADEAHFAATEAKPAPASWRNLEVQGLLFRHAGSRNEAPALDRVAFSLQRGRRYALIGPSGSGKSSLLGVLSGLYLPDEIVLGVDGAAAPGKPGDAARWLRANATLIPQDAEVFEGSLAENLELCESIEGPPPPSRYPEALALSCATDFVDASPAGLTMPVAERGSNWSGGQRQRVGLARGILAAEGSGLLLLDEPTASLDPSTERRVYENLFSAFAGACVISSIHRLNLLDHFDEVILMQAGKVLDCGTPDELTRRSVLFRTMLAAQNRQTVNSEARA